MIRAETYAETIPEPVRAALHELETLFDYPLGPAERFRIDHGEDYGLFYSSLGESACVVASDESGVCGTVSAAKRRIKWPGGAELPCVYGGDLKVHPRAHGGTAYHRLASALSRWTSKKAPCAYSIVMDGTAATPESYSGRAGIPSLSRAAHLEIFSLGVRSEADENVRTPGKSAWEDAFNDLTLGMATPSGGDLAVRSSKPAMYLLGRDAAACGRLEDTRLAKRLRRLDGSEIRAAHLAAFAFRDARSGAALTRQAMSLAHANGAEQLFFSVPAVWAAGMAAALADLKPLRAPATIYVTGEMPLAQNWIVSSSEI